MKSQNKSIQFLKLLLGVSMYFWPIFFPLSHFSISESDNRGWPKMKFDWTKKFWEWTKKLTRQLVGQRDWPKVLLSVVKVCRCLWNSLTFIFFLLKLKSSFFAAPVHKNQSKCQNTAFLLINMQIHMDWLFFTDWPKLYIPSTLNIDLILWHTQLIVYAVKC